MSLNLEINNLVKSPVKKTLVRKTIVKTLEKSGNLELAKKSLTLSLAWVSEAEIRRLNKTYRKKDKATDVLSFCEYEDAVQLKNATEKELFLGELILCYNYIHKYAREKKERGETELARVVSHGVLHLLGFRHGEKMFTIQNEVAEKIK